MVVADTRRLADCFPAIDYFEQRHLPFIVAVNCFDGVAPHTVEQVREALEVPDDIPIVECDARTRASVKMVLLEMAEHSLRRASALVSG